MYPPGKTITAAFAILLAVAGTGWGQGENLPEGAATNIADLSLEQLVNVEVASVYGASKYEQKVTQAPASVSIITADEIQKFGHRTLADVLSGVRGLYVSNDRNYSYLGVRGFLRPGDYNTRVLVLIDGHRMNDNVYDETEFARENLIDVDLIDRVEVIRGPSSSIYGSSAFFGVINVVTKRGQQLGGVEASTEAGSLDTYKGRFSYGNKFNNGVELLLSGSYYTSEGQRKLYFPEFDQRISADPRAANNGIAKNADGEAAFNLFSSARYADFTLSGFFSRRNKEVPTASFLTVFNDGREATTDYRAYLDLKYDHSFSEDSQLQGRVFFDHYSYYGTYPYDYANSGDPSNILLNKDQAVGNWVGTEWQWTRRFLERHILILGGEYRENLRQYQANYDEIFPRTYILNDNRTGRTLGLFAQAELSLRANLVLNAGLRYDQYFGSFGGTLNPRLGLIYNPWENGTFKLLYGEAFRAPNAYEQFYYYSVQQTLPELKPETIRTYELVYEQYLARRYRLSFSGYYYEIKDLISQTTTAAGDVAFANLDGAHAVGGEFELEAKYDSGLMARASYTLQRTEDEGGNELSNSPRHLARLNLIWPLYQDKLFAGVELQYQSAARTLSGNHAAGFVTANLTLFSQKLAKGLEVSASIYNLFDTRYGYPGAEDHLQDVIQQDGRSVRLKLTYRF
jgi:iron complex outermembrane receptor protein